jgi:hypothetical protein
MCSELKKREGRREGVYWLVKCGTKSESAEGGGEVINFLVKRVG